MCPFKGPFKGQFKTIAREATENELQVQKRTRFRGTGEQMLRLAKRNLDIEIEVQDNNSELNPTNHVNQ